MKFSFLVPAFQEEAWIADCIGALRASCSAAETECEVIVCDGGSPDRTRCIASSLGAKVVVSASGRARQINRGFEDATGDVIVMLHADSLLTPGVIRGMADFIQGGGVGGWSQIEVLPERGSSPNLLRLMAWGINLRTRQFHTATADQAIFSTRRAFEEVGGVPELPLLEGMEFVRRIRALGDTTTLSEKVRISGRRWERKGVIRTMLKAYAIRLGYASGVEMNQLVDLWDS